MDIVLGEEQLLLRDSLRRMLETRYPFTKRQAVARSEHGIDGAFWQELADLGILAAPFEEELGGTGLGPLATMIVAEEFGRRLVLEPYFESVTVAGGIIQRDGTAAQRDSYLPGLISGKKIWALAVTEQRSRQSFEAITTRATPSDQGYVLKGAKAAVPAAPWADHLLVSARLDAGQHGGRIGLFVVDARAASR